MKHFPETVVKHFNNKVRKFIQPSFIKTMVLDWKEKF